MVQAMGMLTQLSKSAGDLYAEADALLSVYSLDSVSARQALGGGDTKGDSRGEGLEDFSEGLERRVAALMLVYEDLETGFWRARMTSSREARHATRACRVLGVDRSEEC